MYSNVVTLVVTLLFELRFAQNCSGYIARPTSYTVMYICRSDLMLYTKLFILTLIIAPQYLIIVALCMYLLILLFPLETALITGWLHPCGGAMP